MTRPTRFAPLVALTALLLAVAPAAAQATDCFDDGTCNKGDTSWILTSSALVLFMTPGLALFYGGLVRKKNVVNMILMCFAIIALISVTWVLWGYSLAFAPGGPFVGGLGHLGLAGVANNQVLDGTNIPQQSFMIFQAMFAIITPALIVGAFADRIRFGPLMLFILLWSTLVYSPVAHWVWAGDGWLFNMGALDFAGGTVVHINAGVAALAGVLVLGRRRGLGTEPMVPHNVPMVMLGTAMLWFGWFGFNAGSAAGIGGANSFGSATSAFVVTNTATGAAALTWMLAAWYRRGKPGIVDTCTGAVAGLVAITPASGFVDVFGAIAIGVGAGLICYAVAILRAKKGLDDALDVFAVHGMGGTWGAIATGIFANPVANPVTGSAGLLYGNAAQMGPQIAGVAATWAYTFVVAFVILFVINKAWGLRVKPEEEQIGLDIALHGEEGYT